MIFLIQNKNMKKKLKLSNITLLAATSIEIDMTQLALRISLRNIEFGAVKLLSSLFYLKKPTVGGPARIRTWDQYIMSVLL